ncbi:MAG: BatA domain-containing protein [Ignavibacterium sp.]
MTFLNPAVLFGLLAASIPILLHLLNLRKLKKIEFSSLQFLKELQKNKIRRIKLKQWLLLALRVFIILFLVLAFARPTIKGVAIAGITSSAKTTAVFILDDSFSMNFIDSKGSYFNQAKSITIELIKQLQDGDEVALILTSNNDNKEITPTKNLNDLVKTIDELKISYITNSLNNSLIKAANIIDKSKNYNKEIYIISDFQKSTFNINNSISNLSELLNDKVKVYTIKFGRENFTNLGVDDFKLNTQIFEQGKTISTSAIITNYSDRSLNNVIVSLFINGERTSQKSISIEQGKSTEVILETTLKNSGHHELMAFLEDDDIIEDNKRFIDINIPDKLPIVIFYDNPDDLIFIKLALSSSQNQSKIIIDEKRLNQINSIALNKYKAIFIVGSEEYKNSEKLKNYISNGGSIFLMPGSNSSFNNFKTLCSSISLPSPQTLIELDTKKKSFISFNEIDFQHPIFSDFFDTQDKFQKEQNQKIESPEIISYFRILTEGKGKSIINLSDNSSFLSEYKIDKGKILLLNISPTLKHSDFPLKSIFVPLIYKSVFYLSSENQNENQIIAGEPINLDLSQYPTRQIKVVKPDKNEEIINTKNSNNFYTYDKTNELGIYKFYSQNELKDIFTINHNKLESNLKNLSSEDFENYLTQINFKGKYIVLNKDGNISEEITQARFGSELWKMFLIIAFILALIEMFIARNTKKELVNQE